MPGPTFNPFPLSAGPCGGPLTFVDRLHGWLTVPTGGTTSEILSTVNGGSSWAVVLSAPFGVGELDFVSATDGWALAGASATPAPATGGLLRTTDGGATWGAVGEPGGRFACVDFVSAAGGWALSETGGLFVTADGGLTWSSAPVGAGLGVVSVCFGDANRGWAVASTAVGAPMGIYGTQDGGAAWTLEYSAPWMGGFGSASLAVTCAGSTAWVRVPLGAGAGNEWTEYIRTSDGGEVWTPSPSPTPTGDDFDGMEGPVQIVGGGTVVMAGSDVLPPVLKTVSDGGTSAPVRLPVPSGVLYDGEGDTAAGISFVDAEHGWVLISGVLSDPAAIPAPRPSATAFLTGGGGEFLDAVYATSDGGAAWSLQATHTYTVPMP